MKVSEERVNGDKRISHRAMDVMSETESTTAPLPEWKFHRKGLFDRGATVSARKLAASLWQVAATNYCNGDVTWQRGLCDGLVFEFCSAASIPRSPMEGVTKWDNGYSKTFSDVNLSGIHARFPDYQERKTMSNASAKQAEFFKDQKHVNELQAEEGSSRTRLKRGTNKLDDEGASWMTMEYQQIHSTVKRLKDDVKRARKDCKKMYVLYSKLLNDIAEAKSSARKFMNNYEIEKKTRELLEDLCIEQAKELEACKAEIEELRIQCAEIHQEVAEDRKMLQIANSWREERAQMKLDDAKLILEDRYSQVNSLISDLRELLRSSNSTKDVNETSNAPVLGLDFDPHNIQAFRKFCKCLLNLIKGSQRSILRPVIIQDQILNQIS